MRLILFAVAALSACAAPPTPVWTKTGYTAAEYDADVRTCEFEAVKSVQSGDPAMRSILGSELDKAARRNEVGRACMRSKGYTLK